MTSNYPENYTGESFGARQCERLPHRFPIKAAKGEGFARIRKESWYGNANVLFFWGGADEKLDMSL